MAWMLLLQDKWTSEPDLAGGSRHEGSSKSSRGSWLQRHLSLKRGGSKKAGRRDGSSTSGKSLDEGLAASSQLSGSAPLLITISPVNSPPSTPGVKSFRRPSCVDGVVPVSIIPATPRSEAARTGRSSGTQVIFEEQQAPPPQILATDFDLELETSRF